MKTIAWALMTCLLFSSTPTWAQTAPQAPASWVAFQQQEKAKRIAFFQQMKAERDSFLSSHPEAQAYLDQLHAAAKTRFAARKATLRLK